MEVTIEMLRKISNQTVEQREKAAYDEEVKRARPDVLSCIKSALEKGLYEAKQGNRKINVNVFHYPKNASYSLDLYCQLISEQLIDKGVEEVYVRAVRDSSDVPAIWVSFRW